MIATATRPRLGFLGVGWIGRHRMDALIATGTAEVGAIADPALPEALASLHELLELDLDGVVIATPSALHAEQAIAALERGLAVFCQKPLGRTAAEAAAVVDAARAADRLLAVDLSYRHTESARRIRAAVAAGELGDVYAADLVFHNAYGPDKPWFYDPELAGGGCLIDLGIHLVDLALWTLGGARVVDARGHLHGEPVEQLAFAELELDSDAVVRIACSWNLPLGRDCAIEASFFGTDGGATLRNVDGSYYDFVAELHRGTQTETLAKPPDDWGGRAIVDWAERIARGDGFDPAIADVVEVARVLDRIYGRDA
jgi:predicted dehydrogenase